MMRAEEINTIIGDYIFILFDVKDESAIPRNYKDALDGILSRFLAETYGITLEDAFSFDGDENENEPSPMGYSVSEEYIAEDILAGGAEEATLREGLHNTFILRYILSALIYNRGVHYRLFACEREGKYASRSIGKTLFSRIARPQVIIRSIAAIVLFVIGVTFIRVYLPSLSKEKEVATSSYIVEEDKRDLEGRRERKEEASTPATAEDVPPLEREHRSDTVTGPRRENRPLFDSPSETENDTYTSHEALSAWINDMKHAMTNVGRESIPQTLPEEEDALARESATNDDTRTIPPLAYGGDTSTRRSKGIPSEESGGAGKDESEHATPTRPERPERPERSEADDPPPTEGDRGYNKEAPLADETPAPPTTDDTETVTESAGVLEGEDESEDVSEAEADDDAATEAGLAPEDESAPAATGPTRSTTGKRISMADAIAWERAKRKVFAAAKKGDVTNVRAYLNDGGRVTVSDRKGMTLLHHAAREGHSELVVYLVEEKAEVNKKDKEGHTPLYYAKEQGHSAIAAYLKEMGAKDE